MILTQSVEAQVEPNNGTDNTVTFRAAWFRLSDLYEILIKPNAGKDPQNLKFL